MIKKLKIAISNFIQCKIYGLHKWTCKAEEGIKPTNEEIYGGMEGFKSYSQMYCKKCNKISDLSL